MKVFFQDMVGVQQRFVEQNLEVWVWWRRSPSHLNTWTLFLRAPLYLAITRPRVHATATEASGNISCEFLREGELGSWWHGQRALHVAVGGGGWTVFSRCFSDSVHLDVESRLPVQFLRARDGQQLLVVEGSPCTMSS